MFKAGGGRIDSGQESVEDYRVLFRRILYFFTFWWYMTVHDDSVVCVVGMRWRHA
jgi:hypothetical protein